MGILSGRVAFVTGAGHGQGRSHAIRLAQEGADLLICDACRPIEQMAYPMATFQELEETAMLVEKTGQRCSFAKIDVRDSTGLYEFVQEEVKTLGPVRIVAANAAINIMRLIEDLDLETWQLVIDVNLTGVFNTVKAALPSMVEAGKGGSIIITSSSAAISGLPFHAHYASAKAGLLGLTRALAVELGDKDIRINTIHPGAVTTAMSTDVTLPSLLENPRNAGMFANSYSPLLPYESAEVEDISDAVVFLASDQSRMITGANLPIDMGVSVH
jgi:(+)-trans-carveol dehydrogenase